ncbi:alpha/beta fold hydrolase [Candidatus Woesearchaeota archaeon]|nr:alpha/beta fold hydrolase [Candidatus Woesearchaeota archaeon]
MRRALHAFFMAFLLIGCLELRNGHEGIMKAETIKIETADGFSLEGSFYEGNSSKSILLLHMLGRDRHDYDALAQKLQAQGFSALSIDSRGHGKSTTKQGKTENADSFTEQDFRNMALDVEAAKEYLDKRGKTMTAIVGASIGANTAIKYASGDSGIKTVVLLSPGENYRGVIITEPANNFDRPALVIASGEDAYSVKSSKNISNPKIKLKMLNNKGHGTDMLDNDTSKIIIDWIMQNSQAQNLKK